MNWFSKIFQTQTSSQPKASNKYTIDYFEGKDAFKIARKLFSESVLSKSFSAERRKQKIIASLEFLDMAIEKGYDEEDVFSLRGMCLRDLNFDMDALDDFDKCIEKNPTKASFYYDRAITKQYIHDSEGSLVDFEKAIELSKIDNPDTRYWDDYARQTGYSSGTEKYKHDLQLLLHDMEIMSETFRQDMFEKQKLIRRKK